jgi:hypothetical protein
MVFPHIKGFHNNKVEFFLYLLGHKNDHFFFLFLEIFSRRQEGCDTLDDYFSFMCKICRNWLRI